MVTSFGSLGLDEQFSGVTDEEDTSVSLNPSGQIVEKQARMTHEEANRHLSLIQSSGYSNFFSSSNDGKANSRRARRLCLPTCPLLKAGRR